MDQIETDIEILSEVANIELSTNVIRLNNRSFAIDEYDGVQTPPTIPLMYSIGGFFGAISFAAMTIFEDWINPWIGWGISIFLFLCAILTTSMHFTNQNTDLVVVVRGNKIRAVSGISFEQARAAKEALQRAINNFRG